MVADLIADVAARPRAGDPVRFGLSAFVIARENEEEAEAELAYHWQLAAIDKPELEGLFANADHKALITALCQNEESNGDNTLLTRRNLIQTCLTKVASKNDVSALLDANIAPTLTIIQLRGWADTPEVTQAIETTLRQYQTNPPTPPVSAGSCYARSEKSEGSGKHGPRRRAGPMTL